MPWIPFGLVAKRIAGHDLLPFLGAADEELGHEAETLLGACLENTLQVRVRSRLRPKDEISALEQGPGIGNPQMGKKFAKVGHGDLLVTCDIDGPEKRDEGRHC